MAGQGAAYPADGTCLEHCDCGKNPCGNYVVRATLRTNPPTLNFCIRVASNPVAFVSSRTDNPSTRRLPFVQFDHRNTSFRDWFLKSYMISPETLHHKPLPISLGWLDDAMTLLGPSEEDPHFISDTGSTAQDMADHTAAYQANMAALRAKIVASGGFSWQQMENGPGIARGSLAPAVCTATLREYCTSQPRAWETMNHFDVALGDAISRGEQYTAEFLLLRGPYSIIGYSWVGCSSEARPFPAQWAADYGGEPTAACAETGLDTGVFSREYPKATVRWSCHDGNGSITMKTVVTTPSNTTLDLAKTNV